MARYLLNDSQIKNAKPKEKCYRLNDGEGLYIRIETNGSKRWRFDYTIRENRKTLSLGTYPKISLSNARIRSDAARELVVNGTDPSEQRQQEKRDRERAKDEQARIEAGVPLVGSFEYVAREWLDSIEHTVKPQTHIKKVRRFELFSFPAIGRNPIGEIKPKAIKAILDPIIDRKELETAHRHCAEIGTVFDYAIAHELADTNPAQTVARQIPPQKVKNRAALTEPKDIAQLLRSIDAYTGTFTVQCALKITPLLFQRPGEIRQMQWCDVDMQAREWRYLVTKTESQHIVPLSHQALAILEEIRTETGNGRYVFPSMRRDGRPMSDGAVLTALKTMGYSSDVMTAHGFRTLASTLLNEQGWSPDAIERQLCHQPRDKIRAVYNRAQYLDERRRMMQAWADYLDQLKTGAAIIPFQKAG